MCFCAVRSWVAPWTGPAHCVHLLCCRCSGCLQHHRYSHPEIVSRIHAYIRRRTRLWLNDATKCDLVVCYLGSSPRINMCMFMLARCQRIPGRHRSRCCSALCPWTHSIKMCSFSLMKSWRSVSFSLFSDPSARLPSLQEVMSVGDEAVSVCCAASVKPVFSLIQTNCNFATLYTPAPQSASLPQLRPCHVWHAHSVQSLLQLAAGFSSDVEGKFLKPTYIKVLFCYWRRHRYKVLKIILKVSYRYTYLLLIYVKYKTAL